jgi:bis(5'-nucleosyl)-tetraphosphatase (symmetrical)
MATYAIGDLQGCKDALDRLLETIAFDSSADRLVFAGDLVNRGPDSLGALRLVHSLRECSVSVLGNHDLHLLAVAYAGVKAKGKDTLDEILEAPDRDELLTWLRHCPLVCSEMGFTIVHAGLAMQWNVADAMRFGAELEAVLRGPNFLDFLTDMYGDQPALWSEDLRGVERARFITNALTRTRFCSRDGTLDLNEKAPPGGQPEHLLPWFALPNRASAGEPIAFGHWASLQADHELDSSHGVYHLDAGCVWGGALRALRLDDRRFFEVNCA